jgi:hypothetical protein
MYGEHGEELILGGARLGVVDLNGGGAIVWLRLHRLIVPQAARESDEQGTPQRTRQVGEGVCHHVAGKLDELIAGTCSENSEELV